MFKNKYFLLIFLLLFFMLFSQEVKAEVSIEIIYPNGGEVLEVGQVYDIKWKQSGVHSIYINTSHGPGSSNPLDNSGSLQRIVTNEIEGSFQWLIPDYYQARDDYQILISAAITDPDNPNREIYIEERSDNFFSIVNNTGYYEKIEDVKIDFKNLSVDVGSQDQFVFGEQYKVSWNNVCEGSQAHVYLVYEERNEEEYLVSLRPFKFAVSYQGNNVNNRFGNGFVPNSISSPNEGYLIWTPPTELILSGFSFNTGDTRTAVIIREKDGIMRIYEFQELVYEVLVPGIYKIRVDIRSDECNATGLSKEFQFVNVLGDKLEVNNIEEINEDSINKFNINYSLSNRLKGKLLLQVQDRGRIWYVNLADAKKYEVTFVNALNLFEKLSLGISNIDLYKIPINIDSVNLKLMGMVFQIKVR